MKRRESGERVVVVLDAIKASAEKNGIASLRYALRDLVGPRDEVFVLTILNSEEEAEADPSPCIGCCCMGDESFEQYSCEGDSYIKFLDEEISQRKEAYKQIFRPFYDRCKSIGVKFQVKIVTSFESEAIIEQEADNVGATWIVMDRCFARDQSLQLIVTQCNVALVSDDGDIVVHKNLPKQREAEKIKFSSDSSRPDKQLVSPEKSQTFPNFGSKFRSFLPYRACSSSEGENSTMSEGSNQSKRLQIHDDKISSAGFSEVNLVVRKPLQLSWAEVEEITCKFTRMTCINQSENFRTYCGYLSDHHSQVLVKRFTGQFDCALKAEIKATLSMYHKNVLGLIGYHKSRNDTVLVYPFTRKWTLDRFLQGPKGGQIKSTFIIKLNIAVGIGQGVRYMHEECPQGPIVHGDLRPHNIFLNFDLDPQITGFGKATWLQLKRGSPFSSKRLRHKDISDLSSLALVKSDIFQFGILLLRLFCRRSAPKNEKVLVDWARPLLLQRAYHKLLDEGMDFPDMYGVFRVMSVVAQCLNNKPVSRPSMSEVISLLKGEISCAVALSPSSDGSPNLDLSTHGSLLCS